jgi:hypothetical protein
MLTHDSTGGIIALGLGVKNWSVQECMGRFKNLCNQAFTSRTLGRLGPYIGQKSQYKTKPLEAALQAAFGQDTLLFGGSSQERLTNIKVAITSTTPVENRPVILTNYNTTVPDRNECECPPCVLLVRKKMKLLIRGLRAKCRIGW